tara:strand:+ start:871 stop:1431 length:561 start_codon:yes stop_codon:yes gene_type:complete
MQVKQTEIADLIPYANNSRTHSDSQVAQIAASIKEFGFNNPILLDGDKGIIAGHGRLLAARKLNLDKVPTIELEHLTDAQRKAYIIADNKLALNAGWDMNLLALEVDDLQGEGLDLSLMGFDTNELNAVFDNANDSDDIEELDSINETCNFIIQCKNISEKEVLKSRLGVETEKITFDKFVQCFPS